MVGEVTLSIVVWRIKFCSPLSAVIRGMRIPEGALLFAMHPAIADRARGVTSEVTSIEAEEFRGYAFGVGRRGCLGQGLTEALMPAAVGALLRNFTLKLYPPQPNVVDALGSSRRSTSVRGELRGQLIRPVGDVAMVWERR